MKRTVVMAAMAAALLGVAGSEELPPLPAWSPSDFEKVKRGEIISGRDFFGDQEESPEGGLPLPDGELPPESAEEGATGPDPRSISRVHLIRYFKKLPSTPEGGPMYLIDPQELLAQQELRDRESFLEYHAAESTIDLFVYLFDARQELPEEITLQSVFQDLYRGRDRTAVVFYHLGMPERAQLALSEDIRAVVSQDEESRALRAAVQEAFEKSDAAYQLDNFLVELSIRLYWIERELAGIDRHLAGSRGEVATLAAGTGMGGDGTGGLIYAAIIYVSCLGAIGFLGWVMYYIAEKRVRHVFPEVETGPLLGAPHAAGVGAVVSFSSAHIPPSKQRDQVPDYLQRL